MKNTGEMLRKARESKGISLNELALSLKINSKTLTAIEDGDLAKLPAKTFLRGFVQSYAQALKIDVNAVMASFTEEMGGTRPQSLPGPGQEEAPVTVAMESNSTIAPPVQLDKKADAVDPGLSGLEEASRTKAFLWSGIAIFLLLLIIGTKKIVDRYQRETELAQIEVGEPLVQEPASPTAVTPAPSAAPAAEPTSTATATSPASTPTPTSTTTTPEPSLRSEPAKPVEPAKPIVETPTPTKLVEQAASETAKPAVETKPATPPVEPKKPVARSLELIIEAMDAVEIEYGGTGMPAQKLRLNPDQVHTIRSQSGLKLTVSNGGAVNLILNGRDLGVPGDLGKPVKLTY